MSSTAILRPMSKWLCLALIAICTGVQAAPPPPAEQGISLFIAEKVLLTQFDDVRTRVADRTSDLVMTAMGFLGVPYRRGGTDADKGFDCSGFVRSMYERTVGFVLPRLAKEQA